ncbi:hypothetical protein LUD75_18025 [Epilithonimonas sp. JDS]|uniref:hypothetical protein n=1 Tax=Epilithonimonas sp. JDS TaxID=2902797 RepID=UPI001E5656B3|nr:hypothetical protein [Epilithonimonas sp. JDS]MCD9856626.1 hypothetical protein [Epilithonimonas sp. JDS]
MEEIYNIAGSLSVILLAIALTIAISKYSALAKNEKWYIYYIIFILFIESISYSISFFEIVGARPVLYPIYIAGEFFLVTGIFLKKLKLPNYFFILTGILSLFFVTVDKILPQYENDYSKAVSNSIIICLVAYSLIQEIKAYTNNSHFLAVDAMIFLYFTVSIFIFMFQYQLLKFNLESFHILWAINNVLICILYSTFIYTFLKLKK